MSLSADTLERIVLNIGNHLLDPAPNMLFHGRQPLHAQAILSLAGANSEVRARILVSTEPSMHKKLSCKPCIPCIVCGLDCVTTCHACKKAFYCSQKCQARNGIVLQRNAESAAYSVSCLPAGKRRRGCGALD